MPIKVNICIESIKKLGTLVFEGNIEGDEFFIHETYEHVGSENWLGYLDIIILLQVMQVTIFIKNCANLMTNKMVA